MPPSSWYTCSSPSSRIRMAAFSQRMPPVQKLTTVLSCKAALWARRAGGNSVNLSMRQSIALSNVPWSTSNALRVSSVTTSRPPSSWPCANQRCSVAGSTDGARPCAGAMVGWSMRMISRLTLTSIFRNGTVADQLSLGCRSAKRASVRNASTKPRTASAGPARKKLMPSSARRMVPFRSAATARALSKSRSAAASGRGTNL